MSRAEFAARCKACDPLKNPQEALNLLQEAAKLAEQVDELKEKLAERKKAAESERLRKAAETIDRLIAMGKAAELAERVLSEVASQVPPKATKKATKKPKSKEPRKKYGEFGHIQLTDTERERLVSDFGADIADEYIKICDEYCEQHGKTYKNYYLAIRNFINGDQKKKKGAFDGKGSKADSHAHSYDLEKLLNHAMTHIPKVREDDDDGEENGP